MTQSERISAALRVDSLNLPVKPAIVKIEWDFYEDTAGEESLKVIIVLDDRTTDKEIETAPIHEIKQTVVDSLLQHQVTLFPYFYFERESERVAYAEEE